jgi:hypothetical protein
VNQVFQLLVTTFAQKNVMATFLELSAHRELGFAITAPVFICNELLMQLR